MKKYIIGPTILVLLLAIMIPIIKGNKKLQQGIEIYPERGSIAIEFRVTGSVEPRNQLEIKPQIAGRLEEILVAEGQKVKKGDIIVWMSSTDRAALLDSVRSQGESEIKKWEDVYNPTPMIAPIDGFIIERSREPGQSVTQNDTVLVMADELIIEANVDETDLRYIAIGQKTKIFLDAYPDKEFNGKVEHVAYKAQDINNVTVYKVKILPLVVPKMFKAGMTAAIEIVSQKREGVLLLPVDAVITQDNKKMVTVKSTKGVPEIREVQAGISNGKQVEVVSGITEKDVIIIQSPDKNESKMSPPNPFSNKDK